MQESSRNYESNSSIPGGYRNPVYSHSCPDPFVLKYLNEYWCYSTGYWHDGRCFGVLHSKDLVHWQDLGGAMEPLDRHEPCYWAPEVSYVNGRFLLYYSVGNEEQMQIRVAESRHPAGPFEDCGVRLTSEPFAIDPHVFVDDDGARWMFYATDFLDYAQIGTGTVCCRMVDEFTLAGQAQPVTRAQYAWQIYDPARKEKGGVRWHTVEGPYVLKRKGRYFQMFSSGNWKQPTYGVSYAVTDRLDLDREWEQVADGERILPILRTIPPDIIGPGHNSVVRGPDNRQLYCVYHRWDAEQNQRVMAIDPLEIIGERIVVLGPSSTWQPGPFMPAVTDYFEAPIKACNSSDEFGVWSIASGQWQMESGIIRQTSNDAASVARCVRSFPHFIAEISLRIEPEQGNEHGAGVILTGQEENTVMTFCLLPREGMAQIASLSSHPDAMDEWEHQRLPLPPGFDCSAFHLLRVECNGLRIRILLDEGVFHWEGRVGANASSIGLLTRNGTAEFAGFALTSGWQDEFTEIDSAPLAALGWRTTENEERWQIRDQRLCYLGPHGEPSILTKGPLPRNYELVINVKMMGEPAIGECFGIFPAMEPSTDREDAGSKAHPLLTIERSALGWGLYCCQQQESEKRLFPLPLGYDPLTFHQFRFRKENKTIRIFLEQDFIGEIGAPEIAAMIGLYGLRVIAAFDLVRVASLDSLEAGSEV